MSVNLDPIITFARNDIKIRIVSIALTPSGGISSGSAQAQGFETVDQILGVYITGTGSTVSANPVATPYISGNVVGITVGAAATGLTAQVLVYGY